MIRYLFRRIGQSLVLLVLVSMIGFALLRLTPGGPLSRNPAAATKLDGIP